MISEVSLLAGGSGYEDVWYDGVWYSSLRERILRE